MLFFLVLFLYFFSFYCLSGDFFPTSTLWHHNGHILGALSPFKLRNFSNLPKAKELVGQSIVSVWERLKERYIFKSSNWAMNIDFKCIIMQQLHCQIIEWFLWIDEVDFQKLTLSRAWYWCLTYYYQGEQLIKPKTCTRLNLWLKNIHASTQPLKSPYH